MYYQLLSKPGSFLSQTKMFTDKQIPMFIPLMLLALVVACTNFPTVSAREIKCITRERKALLRLKQGLMDDYGVLSSWGSGEECCQWKGVRCNNTTGHVTAILLQGYDRYNYLRIGGKISSSLLELQFLDHLDLSDNDFGGIPVPRFFGSLENLRILNLRWSNFGVMVPPQLGNLTNLRILDLSSNNIWSENLDWLSHLTLLSELDLTGANKNDSNWLYSVLKLRSLQQLSLYSCSLKDVTPSSDLFLNSSLLQSLSILDLSYNMLTNSTFDWFFNLSTTLGNIDLSINLLEGPIPNSFGRFIFLEKLDLSLNKLTGGVPKCLKRLRHLKYLYLFENNLGGSLKRLFGKKSCKVMISLQEVNLLSNRIKGLIPQEVGACSKLKYLDVGNNKLTGPVPSSLGNLSELQHLSFSFNSLEGVVSESHFLKLQSLKFLDISNNALTLKISPSWIPPFQLGRIQLARCKMGPSFPAWLQTQTSFSSLDISDAAISDKLPKWLWSLSPKLSFFNISYNQLNGPIPDLSLSAIEMIDASYNQLSGRIPLLHPNTSFVQFNNNFFSGSISSICTVSYNMNLILLDLSNNQLVGALPNCWRNMTELMILNLNNNKLFGEIPKSLGSLSNLQTLLLRGNNLSGELPSSLKNCGLLHLMDIGDNMLTGEIPAWLGSSFLASMRYLSLHSNRFHGKIPIEICSLSQIQLLDLSRNNISGELPNCFDNITSLVDKSITTSNTTPIQLSLYHIYSADTVNHALVQWKGQESIYKETLRLLKFIDLSSNNLVGNIPKSFSTLNGLMSLNLSRNNLSGSIDSQIGQMEILEVLDLSRNQLSGEIPVGLAQLHSLAVLDLAHNKLLGKIPFGTQLQSFDESVYAGNDRLCGLPLKPCEANINSGGVEKSDEEEDGGSTRLSFIQEVGISMMFGFILGFWGVVGSFVVKKCWRDAFFRFLDSAKDCIFQTMRPFSIVILV